MELDMDVDGFVRAASATLRAQGLRSQPRTAVKRPAFQKGHVRAGPGRLLVEGRADVGHVSKRVRTGASMEGGSGSLPGEDMAVDSAEYGLDEVSGESAGQDVLSLILPNLDMSTALSSASRTIHPQLLSQIPTFDGANSASGELASVEPIDLVPRFYGYTVKACLLPIRKVQDELVCLYFQQIHPMLPMVDEFYMTQLHARYKNQEELMDPADFMVYHAIMVAAIAHLGESQLLLTPYRSLHEGQEAQFDQVKARYWSGTTNNPAVLTQVSLLLSLWSPEQTDRHNNSYWVDAAFKHAIDGKIWDIEESEYRPTRNRLLWWCCLVRDRLLALGMRRPYRLHDVDYGRDMVTEKDFGFEAQAPSYADLKSKQIAMLVFIWFCKLTDIMAAIAIFQRQNKFSRVWKGEDVAESSIELDSVIALDRDLDAWRRGFEAAVVELLGERPSPVPIPITTVRIISHSLVALLYQPYLHMSWLGHTLVSMAVDPLQKMKDGARDVAMNVAGLLSNKTSDSIPVWLVAWITLPAAVYHVSQIITQNSIQDAVLHPFLHSLVRRSTGAQFLEYLLIKSTRELVEQLDLDVVKIEDTSMMVEENLRLDIKQFSISDSPAQKIRETKVLAKVTEIIDTAFEKNGLQREMSTGTVMNR